MPKVFRGHEFPVADEEPRKPSPNLSPSRCNCCGVKAPQREIYGGDYEGDDLTGWFMGMYPYVYPNVDRKSEAFCLCHSCGKQAMELIRDMGRPRRGQTMKRGRL